MAGENPECQRGDGHMEHGSRCVAVVRARGRQGGNDPPKEVLGRKDFIHDKHKRVCEAEACPEMSGGSALREVGKGDEDRGEHEKRKRDVGKCTLDRTPDVECAVGEVRGYFQAEGDPEHLHACPETLGFCTSFCVIGQEVEGAGADKGIREEHWETTCGKKDKEARARSAKTSLRKVVAEESGESERRNDLERCSNAKDCVEERHAWEACCRDLEEDNRYAERENDVQTIQKDRPEERCSQNIAEQWQCGEPTGKESEGEDIDCERECSE